MVGDMGIEGVCEDIIIMLDMMGGRELMVIK